MLCFFLLPSLIGMLIFILNTRTSLNNKCLCSIIYNFLANADWMKQSPIWHSISRHDICQIVYATAVSGARILRRKRVNHDISRFTTKVRKCFKMGKFATKEGRCIKLTFIAFFVNIPHKLLQDLTTNCMLCISVKQT